MLRSISSWPWIVPEGEKQAFGIAPMPIRSCEPPVHFVEKVVLAELEFHHTPDYAVLRLVGVF
jgi:hypothetical protein